MGDPTVGIIGGGILGLAIGRELGRRRPGTRAIVLEKEDRLLCFGKLEERRSMIPERRKRQRKVKKLPKQPIHDV